MTSLRLYTFGTRRHGRALPARVWERHWEWQSQGRGSYQAHRAIPANPRNQAKTRTATRKTAERGTSRTPHDLGDTRCVLPPVLPSEIRADRAPAGQYRALHTELALAAARRPGSSSGGLRPLEVEGSDAAQRADELPAVLAELVELDCVLPYEGLRPYHLVLPPLHRGVRHRLLLLVAARRWTPCG